MVGLVACYGFGGFLDGMRAVAIRMTVATTIAAGWRNAHRLAGVGEVSWHRFGDVLNRADLDYGRLGLLQHQFFVNSADLGLFLKRLLPARPILFGRRQGDVMLEVAHASGIVGVNPQRVFEAFEVDA